MSSHLSLVEAVDELYAAVVRDPAAWGDLAFSEWLTRVDASSIAGRAEARWLQRAMRAARRLARYWSDPVRAGQAPPDWQSAVDAALGSRGWVPTYELARLGAEATRDPELFGVMSDRFRLINFEPFPYDYDQWVAEGDPG